MTTNEKNQQNRTGDRETSSIRTFRFTCPECGGSDLLWHHIYAWFQKATVDKVEVDQEDPSEYEIRLRPNILDRFT